MKIPDLLERIKIIGLPKYWQAYVLFLSLISSSIIFITNELLLNITNIVATTLVSVGVIFAIKYYPNREKFWSFLAIGVVLVSISVILKSLLFFGLKIEPLTIAIIEQIGIFSSTVFAFIFFLLLEKKFNLKGFTLDYSLVIISIVASVFILAPNLLNNFLYEISIFQQFMITNLMLGMVLLSMILLNYIINKKLLLKDVIKLLIVLSLTSHFSLEIINSFTPKNSNVFLSNISWSIYHLVGVFTILFIFLEKDTFAFDLNTTSQISSKFMWSASILAVLGIPLSVIVRDRLGFEPISILIISTAIFFLSSIVVWRLQMLVKNSEIQSNKLRTIAYTDPLTNLLNYHGYLEKLSNIRTKNLLVLSLNVEDFKSINDLHGRDFGDNVLRSLAQRLEMTPHVILTARTGSDYFQAVFKTPVKNIPTLIKTIQEHLGIWDTVNNRRIAVPITYGASYSSKPIKPEALAREAEQALKISRNTHTDFTLYSKDKVRKSRHAKDLPRHELREILQKALDDNYLPVHFQPIYDLRTGALKALELLIRVESKEHGLLLPGQFLEQAQAYGLLTPLTQVCVNMVAKCYDQLPDVTVNINVPPYMLNNPQVLNNFISCFVKARLPMEHFCIEVTEDGDIPTDHLIPAIKLLKSHGFRIAMDDFGTGYSSLSRLSVLPVDVVKIDRSLLLAASAGNKSILESAITLTKRLGATTVVEGVETLEQLSLIRKLGADSVQGFLLSRPVQISKASLLSLNAADIVPDF